METEGVLLYQSNDLASLLIHILRRFTVKQVWLCPGYQRSGALDVVLGCDRGLYVSIRHERKTTCRNTFDDGPHTA